MRIKTVVINDAMFRINYDPDLQVFWSPDRLGIQEESESELQRKLTSPTIKIVRADQVIHLIVTNGYIVQIERGVIEQYDAGAPSFITERDARTASKPSLHTLMNYAGDLPFVRISSPVNGNTKTHYYLKFDAVLLTALLAWSASHGELTQQLLVIIERDMEAGTPVDANAVTRQATIMRMLSRDRQPS